MIVPILLYKSYIIYNGLNEDFGKSRGNRKVQKLHFVYCMIKRCKNAKQSLYVNAASHQKGVTFFF